MSPQNRKRRWISTGLQVLVAAILLQTLYFKFTAAEESVYIFSRLGLEPWGRIGSGLGELAAGVLLLVPVTAVLGALLALAIIVPAVGFHLTVLGIEVQGDGGLLFALAVMVLVASLAILWLRRDELARHLGRLRGRPGGSGGGAGRTLSAALALGLALAGAAAALDPVNRTPEGLALHGYDPLAYFEAGRPLAGDPALTLDWSGATWRFTSAERRDRFAADPERYAPRFGGYCAWAVSRGYTADIDPQAWKIVDGRLYLNYSLKILARWERDIPGHIERAEKSWPRLLAGS